MTAWLGENAGTIVVALILAGVVISIIMSMIKRGEKGSHASCGCCSHCPMCETCGGSRVEESCLHQMRDKDGFRCQVADKR